MKITIFFILFSSLANANDVNQIFYTKFNQKADSIAHDGIRISSDNYVDINTNKETSFLFSDLLTKRINQHPTFEIAIADMNYSFSILNIVSYLDGYISVTANINNDESYPSFITIYDNQIYGDFYTPNGFFKADVINKRNVLLLPNQLHNKMQLTDEETLNPTSQIFSRNIKSLNYYDGINKSSNTTLDLGFVFTNAVGGSFNSSSLSYVFNGISAANTAFSQSNINIRLNPRMFANLKPGVENSFSNNVNTAQSIFRSQQRDIIDHNSNNGFYVSGNKNLPVMVNQFVLVMGSGSGVCGKAGFARQLSNFLTIRKSGICNSLTLAHEIGHNLSLLHSDGTYKGIEPSIDGQGTFSGWQSIMYDVGNFQWKYFTGGQYNSVYNTIFCNGTCNTEPFQDHDSITRLNNIRFSAGGSRYPFPKPEDIFDFR